MAFGHGVCEESEGPEGCADMIAVLGRRIVPSSIGSKRSDAA